MHEVPRSRGARAAAEIALVRVVSHFGERPDFVVLGGLVPDLLCAASPIRHAGTTDVDVQVDIEIAGGSKRAAKLEKALRAAEFSPDDTHFWRWEARDSISGAIVRFELLADLDDQPNEATIQFTECEQLGAVNLRGTRFASRDIEVRELSAEIRGEIHTVGINVAGLAGFLLAKAAAAYSRRRTKDWYDIAFVLIHNDAGGPGAAAVAVLDRFSGDISGSTRTALLDLQGNFANLEAQGPRAYAQQSRFDQPGLEPDVAAADAVTAIEQFIGLVLE